MNIYRAFEIVLELAKTNVIDMSTDEYLEDMRAEQIEAIAMIEEEARTR